MKWHIATVGPNIILGNADSIALELAGVEFTNRDQPGVRLRKGE